MTSNGAMTFILLYLTEFGSIAGLLRHRISIPLLATTDPPCSAISLR